MYTAFVHHSQTDSGSRDVNHLNNNTDDNHVIIIKKTDFGSPFKWDISHNPLLLKRMNSFLTRVFLTFRKWKS